MFSESQPSGGIILAVLAFFGVAAFIRLICRGGNGNSTAPHSKRVIIIRPRTAQPQSIPFYVLPPTFPRTTVNNVDRPAVIPAFQFPRMPTPTSSSTTPSYPVTYPPMTASSMSPAPSYPIMTQSQPPLYSSVTASQTTPTSESAPPAYTFTTTSS
ncbi:MAG: hypothetical protein J3R72DRAFT_431633 [Linnemannia gamsii]|nr:MAG: hypothetical protein J3R72DRAFT_431633 [Linnemannia gamsii]